MVKYSPFEISWVFCIVDNSSNRCMILDFILKLLRQISTSYNQKKISRIINHTKYFALTLFLNLTYDGRAVHLINERLLILKINPEIIIIRMNFSKK